MDASVSVKAAETAETDDERKSPRALSSVLLAPRKQSCPTCRTVEARRPPQGNAVLYVRPPYVPAVLKGVCSAVVPAH
jgi:hypothetical protein